MSKVDEESKVENMPGFWFGKYILGPVVLGGVFILVFAFPIWILWNRTVCDVFPLFNPISYGQCAGLCTIVWCLGRVWKGVFANGKN